MTTRVQTIDADGQSRLFIEGKAWPKPNGLALGVGGPYSRPHPRRPGMTDPKARLIDMDSEGIDIAVLFGGGQGAMLAAVMSGRISAGLLNPPHNFLGYRQGLKNLGFAGSYVRIPSTGLVATRERLERSPDQVRRMTRALTRARAFARDNKGQAVAVLKRFLQLDDEELVATIYDYHKKVETAGGKIDAALAAETIRDARQTEGIAREIPAGQVFDFSFLETAR